MESPPSDPVMEPVLALRDCYDAVDNTYSGIVFILALEGIQNYQINGRMVIIKFKKTYSFFFVSKLHEMTLKKTLAVYQ